MLLTTVLGMASDARFADALHHVGHAGGIEYIDLNLADTRRRRLRVTTDRGTDCAIALPRDAELGNGAVLLLEPRRAVVVRLAQQAWLRVRPADRAAALETGYHAGNHHWTVRFDGGDILIALEGPRADYLERLAPLLDTAAAMVVDDD